MGTGVMVIGVSGDFCKVRNTTGSIVGYIPSAYLSHDPSLCGRTAVLENGVFRLLDRGRVKASVEMVDWYDAVQYVSAARQLLHAAQHPQRRYHPRQVHHRFFAHGH